MPDETFEPTPVPSETNRLIHFRQCSSPRHTVRYSRGCINRLIWNFGSWNQNISNYNAVKQGDHDSEHAVRAVPIDLASNIKS